MTATLGETYAAPHAEATVEEAAAPQSRKLAPRRARRELATQVAHSTGGHRVVVAMIGTLGVMALAGVVLQFVAG